MARWTESFTPITLMPDENVKLRKRESLRLRGLNWTALFASLLALLMFSLCVGIAARGWQAGAELAIRTIFILLLMLALPAFLILYTAWLDDSHTLSAQKICPRQGMFVRLDRWFRQAFNRPAPPAAESVDCAQVWRVSVEPSVWPMSWFDIGKVVISSRSQARALVMEHVSHPHLVEEEIMRYARRASGSGDAGEGELLTRHYRASLAWLALQIAPGLILLWAGAMFWFGLRLVAWLGADALWTTIEVLAILWVIWLPLAAISFLRWWYCVYLVTDRRVVGRKGLLKLSHTDLRLEEVVSASVTQAGFTRYMGIGTVQVNTAGHSGSVKMVNISEPGLVRQTILDIQERLKKQQLQMEFGEIRGRLVRALRL